MLNRFMGASYGRSTLISKIINISKKIVLVGGSILMVSLNADYTFADTNFDIANGYLETIDGETYYITGSTSEDSLNNIKVDGGLVRIVLKDVDMSLSDWVEAMSITDGAIVNLVLEGNNKIETGWGINVEYGSTLNISGDGSLNILARNSSAIGNVLYNSNGMGNINIQSGNLYLKSEYGCGIGATVGKDGVGKVGDITISGGNITAIGSTDCAGIGSGNDSSLGNIYIGGDAVVEASSIKGAGIGTGALEKTTDASSGDINIAGAATVKAVSYSGAGIGTGDNQDKKLTVNINEKANVYAESHDANSIGDGAETNVNTSDVTIGNETNVNLVSYRADTLPENSNANVYEVKLDSAPVEDTIVKFIDSNGNESSIKIPKDAYSVSTNTNAGTDIKVVSFDGDDLNTDMNGSNYTKKEISLKKVADKTIYVSVYGNDENSGKSYLDPVKTFKKAYELVNNNGTIVICNGNIKVDRIPRLNKHIIITTKDEQYDYQKMNPSLTIDLSRDNFYDKTEFKDISVYNDGAFVSEKAKDKFIMHNVKLIKTTNSNITKLGQNTANTYNKTFKKKKSWLMTIFGL